MGTELFPDANAPLLRIRLRAPAGTRIEETERIVLRALDVIQREAGRDNVRDHQRFRGLFPPAIPWT
jgi:multidrug efflux pump subunit AcrB